MIICCLILILIIYLRKDKCIRKNKIITKKENKNNSKKFNKKQKNTLNDNTVKSNSNKEKIIFKYILPILLAVVFIVRLFSYETVINVPIGLDKSYLNSKILTVITLLSIWCNYASILFIILRGFYDIKLLRTLIRTFVPISFIINSLLIVPTVTLFLGEFKVSLLFFLLIAEIIIGLGLSIYYIIKDFKETINVKEIFITLGILLLLLIPVMPSYMLQFIFGYVKANLIVRGFSFTHRVVLYASLIIPITLFFVLRKKEKVFVEFILLYISLATLIVFMVNYDYTILASPWDWPFHLCNTAMFIIPICIIFKTKHLFYFTYFINVVGALIAMLMPNYIDATNLFSTRILVFWYNHYIAFFMPILLVMLDIFKRPKLKQFSFAMIWFLVYFMLVLTLNVVFPPYLAKYHPELEKEIDFFFLNGNHIVLDVLENVEFVQKLYDVTIKFEVNDMIFQFRPIYQGLFFLTYIGIAAGVWFVYEEMYRVVDKITNLLDKLHIIKFDEFALQSSLNGRSLELPMNETAGIKYELIHFSKKYGNNKHYSVEDANLEVFGGEIFGFLGPNGAGKSTIIKSTVGIQPLSEGRIEICGYDIAKQPVYAKAQIGYVPDHYALYEKLTGREYINYIADIYGVSEKDRNERIEKHIKLFELDGKIDNKIETYSHGMKQKITIMAALVHNPKVWILDEPLTGLDPNSIYQVKECMKQHAKEGNIVFFSSHIIDIVEKLCERIAIIKKGHIMCVKTVKEIEESGMTLEEFYLDQISDNEAKNE